MDELVVRTDVYADADDVYDLLADFPRYVQYSDHLERVEQTAGDGGPGTRYALTFRWWKLTYTVHSEVTDVDPPNRIDWTVRRNLDAHGCWTVSPIEDADGDPNGETPDADDPVSEVSARDASATDASATDASTTDVDDPAPDPDATGEEMACEVTFRVQFDPHSANADALRLPRFVSLDWVIRKATPIVRKEARRVFERAVADIEGTQRSIALDVEIDSSDS